MARFFLTAQNIDIYDGDGLDSFARTGAVSVDQISRAGASGVILGHSEVGDSPEVLQQKFAHIVRCFEKNNTSLEHNTLLVGESWNEFKDRSPEEVAESVAQHLALVVEGLPPRFAESLIVGYEPKWGSRGSGRDDMPPPQPELISTVAERLKIILTEAFGATGKGTPIIYGGRSTPERTSEILADKNIEGLILGSACASVEKTLAIAKSMEAARPGKRKILHANFKAYTLPDSYEKYVAELSKLDDTFSVYLSPAHTDIRAVKDALR